MKPPLSPICCQHPSMPCACAFTLLHGTVGQVSDMSTWDVRLCNSSYLRKITTVKREFWAKFSNRYLYKQIKLDHDNVLNFEKKCVYTLRHYTNHLYMLFTV